MVRHSALSRLALLAALGAAACNAPLAPVLLASLDDEPTLCRPAHIAPGILEIGPETFSADVVAMRVSESPEGFGAALTIELTGTAEGALVELTEAYLDRELPVSIDGEEVFRPIVRAPVSGNSMELTGGFTREELEAIAIRFAAPCEAAALEPRAVGE